MTHRNEDFCMPEAANVNVALAKVNALDIEISEDSQLFRHKLIDRLREYRYKKQTETSIIQTRITLIKRLNIIPTKIFKKANFRNT